MLQSLSTDIYNGCDMGLGKTCMSVVYANSIRAKSILVICPASLKLVWSREFAKWSVHNYQVVVCKSYKQFKTLSIENKKYVLILSYNLLAGSEEIEKSICSKTWDLMILDEAHKIRTVTSNTSKAVNNIWVTSTRRVMALSGTPQLNQVTDLYPQFRNIVTAHPRVTTHHKEIFSKYNTFCNTFAYAQASYFSKQRKINYIGLKNEALLKDILYNKYDFFFRVTKDEAGIDMPKKSIELLEFDVTVQSKEFDKDPDVLDFVNNLSAFDKGGPLKPMVAKMLNLLGKVKSKDPEIISHFKYMLESREPIVIFAYHSATIANLKEALSEYNPVVIQGSTSQSARQAAVDDFQNGKSQVLIGQIESAGVGITLHRARFCFFIETTWLPSLIKQAIDRLHRIGQIHPVIAYFITTNNSIDRAINSTMLEKQKLINKIF